MATSQNLVTSMPTLSNISSNGDGSVKNENDKPDCQNPNDSKKFLWHYTTPRTGTFCQMQGAHFMSCCTTTRYSGSTLLSAPKYSKFRAVTVYWYCAPEGSRVFSCTVPGKIVALQYTDSLKYALGD
jgi:hypothetical protein